MRRFLAFAGDARPRRPQRALRHGVPRPRGRAAHRPPRGGAGGRHGVARPAAARAAASPRRARVARALLRHDAPSRATARCPTRRRRPRSSFALLGLAQERGARTVADVVELAAPRARRLHGKRALVAGAPPRPGVYLFRDRREQVLYVGQGARPARAAALVLRGRAPAAGGRGGARRARAVEWRESGSELEAALEELRLIRELRPPANARGKGRQRRVAAAARRELVVVIDADALRADRGQGRSRAARRARSTATSGDDLAPALPPVCASWLRGSRASSASRTRRDCVTASRRSSGRAAVARARPAPRASALPARPRARARLLRARSSSLAAGSRARDASPRPGRDRARRRARRAAARGRR